MPVVISFRSLGVNQEFVAKILNRSTLWQHIPEIKKSYVNRNMPGMHFLAPSLNLNRFGCIQTRSYPILGIQKRERKGLREEGNEGVPLQPATTQAKEVENKCQS